jgi:hypothetical protein
MEFSMQKTPLLMRIRIISISGIKNRIITLMRYSILFFFMLSLCNCTDEKQPANKQCLDSVMDSSVISVKENKVDNVLAVIRENNKSEPSPKFFNDIGTLGTKLCLITEPAFEIFNDSILKSETTVDLNNPNYSGLTPIFFAPDVGIFYLVVLKEHYDYLTIQKNKNEIAYIKRSDIKEIVNWNSLLLKKSTGVDNPNWMQNPPLKSMNGKVKTIKYKKDS